MSVDEVFRWCQLLFVIFLEMLKMCSFQFRFESNSTPRYLTHFVCVISLLFRWREKESVTCFCDAWNRAKLVLLIFSDKLLEHSHSWILNSSSLIVVSAQDPVKFYVKKNKFESSAKRWRSKTEDAWLKSFIYSKNI